MVPALGILRGHPRFGCKRGGGQPPLGSPIANRPIQIPPVAQPLCSDSQSARTSTELWVPRRVSMFEYQDFVFRAPVLDFIPRVLHRLFIKLASSAECQQFLVPQLH